MKKIIYNIFYVLIYILVYINSLEISYSHNFLGNEFSLKNIKKDNIKNIYNKKKIKLIIPKEKKFDFLNKKNVDNEFVDLKSYNDIFPYFIFKK